MNTYFRSILLTVAGCHLLLLVTAELGGEQLKKHLRFLCGIVLLITIFSPLQGFLETLHQSLDTRQMSSADENTLPADTPASAAVESTCSYIAEQWMVYLTEQYDISRETIRVILYTDDAETLTHGEIHLQNCYYALRETIEKDMNTQTDIPISVKGW